MSERGEGERDFRWVKARQECSPFEVLKLLQLGCERDVEDRQGMRQANEPVAFRLVAHEDAFLVLREGNGICASVEFKRTQAGIAVRDGELTAIVEGTLIVNDEGACRLQVGKQELQFWQFRRRALQGLFFEYPA